MKVSHYHFSKTSGVPVTHKYIEIITQEINYCATLYLSLLLPDADNDWLILRDFGKTFTA